MAFGRKERKQGRARPDGFGTAVFRVALLAPGGFVAGYGIGRALGRLVSDCPLSGPCSEANPVLLAVPLAILGMGVGSTVAAARLSEWWEGILVWGAGIAWMLVLVVAIGWLGVDSQPGRILGLAWLLAALAMAVAIWRRAQIEE